MHSSRIRTIHNSSRLLEGGSGPGGCLIRGVSGPGGVPAARGVPAPGGGLVLEGSAPGGCA